MRPVSDSFLNTVRGPHTAIFRARLVSPWAIGVNPAEIAFFGINSGDVIFDTGSDVNSTVDLTTDLEWDYGLAPYGTEMYIERGVEYANGIQEFVGLGYYRINSVEQTTKGLLRISGEDRKANLRDGRPVNPIQFTAGTSVAAVLDFLVQDVMPGMTTQYDSDWPSGSAYTTNLATDQICSDNRLGFIQTLIASYGKVCYFDYAGRFTVKSQPDPTTEPVFEIGAGQNGVLVEATRSLSRDGVYNGVVARGEPVGELPPVQAVVVDTDPNSPTLWGGSFGKVPRFFSSSFMTTASQCLAAAQGLLLSVVGLPYSVSLGLVPNPALETYDVLTVKYDEHTYETHIADSITVPLHVDGVMQIETRKQSLTIG